MLQEEVPQRSIKSVLDVGCCKITKTIKKVVDRTLLHPSHPPETRNPSPTPHPPTNVPTNGSAEKHEELPKVARTSVETSATDHTRCSEVTMIWKETRTRRGLRRPSEPQKKGKRTLIHLSETFGGSGNPRAGGTNAKPSGSYEKMRKPMVNHQIPMRKDEKTYGKPSDVRFL